MLSPMLLSLTLLVASLQRTLASPVESVDHGSSYFAPLYIPPTEAHNLINNSYIVMFRDNVLPSAFTAHMNFIELAKGAIGVGANDVALEHVYNSAIAKGYAGKLTPEILEMIRSRPEVEYVEQDQIVYGDDIQENPPWGLARINHRVKITDRLMHYAYPRNSGAGVVVYVVDSGVLTAHNEFEGRARWGKSFIPSEGRRDLHGHGTHVAGTIASRLYGVAKKAHIIAVKVLDKENRGRASSIVAGLEYVLTDSERFTSQPQNKGVVVNLSLGGSPSRAKDSAANNAVKAGLHVVAAAGNDNKDACLHSPASASLPITVGASTIDDRRRGSSNHGKCVDIFAPGSDTLSCGIADKDASKVMSGTSMATPHVSGIIAHFLSLYPHRTFHPPSEDDSDFESYLASALTVAHDSLPGFLSGILPSPSHFSWRGKHDDAQNVEAVKVTPLMMKRALLALAAKDKLDPDSLPEDTPNLLVYNNYTHRGSLWEEEPFMLEYDQFA